MSLAAVKEKFHTRISPYIRRQIATLNQADGAALTLQFSPDTRELDIHANFIDDPLNEEDNDIHPFVDVIHKYPNKILYLTTDECPVYCRYCTRKRKTLLSIGHKATPIVDIAEYLHARPHINEVIFSGGDPLMLPASDLVSRARNFLSLETIQFLRFHTRAVTTAPELISKNMVDGLRNLRAEFPHKSLAFVLHINTAAELSDLAVEKIALLRSLTIPLYSQSVLLKSINDSAHSLATLCRALLAVGVQPYYLHQLDRVTGAAHFEVEDDEARLIYGQLQSLVPRYMIPKLVRDSKQGKYPL